MRISVWSSDLCSSDLEQHRADEAQEVGVSLKRRNRPRKQPARLPQPFQRRTTMAVASLSAVHTGITVAQSVRAHQLLQQSAAIVDLIGASLEGDLLPAEH